MKTTGRQWAGRTAVVGTVFIALGAFWLSFTALADLAARSGVDRGQAWAWPLSFTPTRPEPLWAISAPSSSNTACTALGSMLALTGWENREWSTLRWRWFMRGPFCRCRCVGA